MAYRTVGFQPAPPGWRAVWKDEKGGYIHQDLAGWVLLEECSEKNGQFVPLMGGWDEEPLPEMEIHAACSEGGVIIDVSGDNNFYTVLGPNENVDPE